METTKLERLQRNWERLEKLGPSLQFSEAWHQAMNRKMQAIKAEAYKTRQSLFAER